MKGNKKQIAHNKTVNIGNAISNVKYNITIKKI